MNGWNRLSLAVLLGLCACGAGLQETMGKKMVASDGSSVFYTQSVGSKGTLGVLLSAEQFLVRTDTGQPPHSAVGLFRMTPPPGELGELLDELSKLGVQEAQPSGGQRPGTPMISFGLKQGETTKQIWSTAATTIPERLAPVIKRFRDLIQQILSHPAEAVAARAEWQADSFAAGQDLQLKLVIENVGATPQTLANPAAPAQGGSGIGVNMIRDRKPQKSGDSTFHNLEAAEVRQLEQNGVDLVGSPPETISLPPGKEVAFSLRKTVRLAPGSYRANLSLVVTPAGEGADSPARGAITLELPAVTITR